VAKPHRLRQTDRYHSVFLIDKQIAILLNEFTFFDMKKGGSFKHRLHRKRQTCREVGTQSRESPKEIVRLPKAIGALPMETFLQVLMTYPASPF
jgi:hypothetical protein